MTPCTEIGILAQEEALPQLKAFLGGLQISTVQGNADFTRNNIKQGLEGKALQIEAGKYLQTHLKVPENPPSICGE